MCSLDARSGRPIQSTLLEEIRASLEGTLYRVLIGLLCSRNAWSGTPLARAKGRLGALRVGWVRNRAQWETNRPTP
jgi:hypothetical protein